MAQTKAIVRQRTPGQRQGRVSAKALGITLPAQLLGKGRHRRGKAQVGRRLRRHLSRERLLDQLALAARDALVAQAQPGQFTVVAGR